MIDSVVGGWTNTLAGHLYIAASVQEPVSAADVVLLWILRAWLAFVDKEPQAVQRLLQLFGWYYVVRGRQQ
jgi:hypothetical protein